MLQLGNSLKLTSEQVVTIKQISRDYAVRRDSITTDLARYFLLRHGDYRGADVRERWHAAGIASFRGYLADIRTLIANLTPEQRAMAGAHPFLFGLVNLSRIRDEDESAMFRGPMSGLP